MKNGVASMRDVERGAKEHEEKILATLGLELEDVKLFGTSHKITLKILDLMRISWQDGFQSGLAFAQGGGKLSIHPEDDELKAGPFAE